MQNKKRTLYSFLFLILLWQISFWIKGESVFFPSFFQLLSETLSLIQERSFLGIVSRTLLRVILGCSLCFGFAFVLAFLAFWKAKFEILWTSFFQICRILPSVVLIVLLLIFFPIAWIPYGIQICVVLPLLYEQSLKSLQAMNPEYHEFLQYYEVSAWKKFRYVYLPIVLRAMYKNMESILGLCMKVTIAGELLAQEEKSIGGEIFTEKMYLNIPRVLAWCFVLLLLHIVLMFVIKRLGKEDE